MEKYGIAGRKAPELEVPFWIDGNGKELAKPILLSDFSGRQLVIFCFQSWCRGCHTTGLPALKYMSDALNGFGIGFLAIQTVFEGKESNTPDKLFEVQQRYGLAMPFGHDEGTEATMNVSSTLYHYRTGGTPWFILVNKEGIVTYNGYQIDARETAARLKEQANTLT